MYFAFLIFFYRIIVYSRDCFKSILAEYFHKAILAEYFMCVPNASFSVFGSQFVGLFHWSLSFLVFAGVFFPCRRIYFNPVIVYRRDCFKSILAEYFHKAILAEYFMCIPDASFSIFGVQFVGLAHYFLSFLVWWVFLPLSKPMLP